MVHVRLNEHESNPNPHVNFITPLPLENSAAQENARQLLRALAAQVRPVMKAHGFSVNSLEEYEYNAVFAGRNWNNGETVEIVLRKPDGSFYPASWLMSTLCHELAHIKHMNHGPDFQALWKRLRMEVRNLQDKGYYGDGYWSAGMRLADSARVGGEGVESGDFPEYMCGGAQKRTRPTARRRRRPRNPATNSGPSLHTGRQTAKRRKAGARVTSAGVFVGEGSALNEDANEDKKGKGIGFRKKAGSKRAREERALAAEQRLRALQAKTQAPPSIEAHSDEVSETDTDDESALHETDQDRRRTLLNAMKEDKSDLDALNKVSWNDFKDDFYFGAGNSLDCDVPVPSVSGSSFTTVATPSLPSASLNVKSTRKGKSKSLQNADDASESSTRLIIPHTKEDKPKQTTLVPGYSGSIGLGKMVQTEMHLRKQESLGMAPLKEKGRTLGGSGKVNGPSRTTSTPLSGGDDHGRPWNCLVCTLSNEPGHLACSVCGTARGEVTWHRQQ